MKKLSVAALTCICLSFNIKAHDYNHLGIFTGLTTSIDAKHTSSTLGIDYEQRFANIFGIGPVLDIVFASHTEILVGGALYFRPLHSLKFWVSPGYLAYTLDETRVHKYVTRLGIGYDFRILDICLTPVLNLDLIKGGSAALVYGLALNFGL